MHRHTASAVSLPQNHWYATMRAKADSKTRTFLWTYGMIAGKEADPNNVDLARVRWVWL